MTKKIIEHKLRGKLRFEFVNLSHDEDYIYFISDILENELNAEVIDVFHGFDYYYISLRKDGIDFKVFEETYFGLCLELIEQNRLNNKWLRELANEVLSLIKTKGSKYLTQKAKKKRKERVISDHKYLLSKYGEEDKND